jgi:hypothetical protein
VIQQLWRSVLADLSQRPRFEKALHQGARQVFVTGQVRETSMVTGDSESQWQPCMVTRS